MNDTAQDSSTEEAPPAGGDVAEAGLLAGRYRLVEPLGEGAMGEVYSAEHVLMQKQVAIKVLRSEMSDDDEIVARFHREARAAAALDHPNVCQATDFGQNDEGAFFLVMEFLRGQTLQEVIDDDGPMNAERALHIARQIADALHVAHEQGIVHRDLKPENIMLIDRQGEPDFVKIMDFGIARLLTGSDGEEADASNRLTRQGMVYGTPHYMSPEQVAGDDVDEGTDIYALGVVLFEMLTGSPPFDGDNIARVMGKHVTQPVPKLEEKCPSADFPDPLEALVARLLAKDRDDRPATATEVVDAIHGLDGQLDAPPSAQTPTAKDSDALTDITQTMSAVTRETSRKSVQLWKGLPPIERGAIVALIGFFIFFGTLIFGGLLLYAFMTDDERQAQAIEDHRQALLEDPEITDAIDAAAGGSRDELEVLLDEHNDDPHLRYLALKADLEAGRSIDWIDEGHQLFEFDERYAHEPELVQRLVDELPSNDDVAALLAEHITPTVRDSVAEQARTGTPRATRNTAYEFLEDTGQMWRLDDWQRITADMRQSSCPDLSDYLEELVEIGDPGAIPTLEAYQAKSTRGCGRSRMRDCFSCIRSDLGPAIEALEES